MPYSLSWKSTQRAIRILEGAVEAARVGDIHADDLCEAVGISLPTLFSYFPSTKDLKLAADLVLLEEEFQRLGSWAEGDEDAWDSLVVGARFDQWCQNALETRQALRRLQVVSSARSLDGGSMALKRVLINSAQPVSDRLRDLDARRLISINGDAFTQAHFMNLAGLLGWWNEMLPDGSPVRSTNADLTVMFREMSAGLLRARPQERESRVQRTDTEIRPEPSDGDTDLFDAELRRILSLEVDDPSHQHFQVVRAALDLIIEKPTGDFSIGELNAQSGVPQKRTYELFTGKEQIMRVALTAFTASTASTYIRHLQHLPERPDPLGLIGEMLGRFREPSSRHYRYLRVRGYAAASSSTISGHLDSVESSALVAVEGIRAAQQRGLIRDQIPAQAVVSLILGIGGIRPILDVLGNGLPEAVWSQFLDTMFAGLLAID